MSWGHPPVPHTQNFRWWWWLILMLQLLHLFSIICKCITGLFVLSRVKDCTVSTCTYSDQRCLIHRWWDDLLSSPLMLLNVLFAVLSSTIIMVTDNYIASSLLLIRAMSWGLVVVHDWSLSNDSDSEANELLAMLKKINCWYVSSYSTEINLAIRSWF